MVSFTQNFPIFACEETPDVRVWLTAAETAYPGEDAQLIQRACEFAAPLYAERRTLAGALLLQHALGAASILAEMRLDAQAVAAAVLHAVPDCLENSAESLEWRIGDGGVAVCRIGPVQRGT